MTNNDSITRPLKPNGWKDREMTAQFEDFEMPDYEHDTTADDVADTIYDGLTDRDWVKEIGLGEGGMVVTDVNGRRFLVKVEALS